MKYVRILAILILSVTFIGLLYGTLHAQNTTNGLAVHPSNFELQITPNEKTTHQIVVDNLTNNDLTIEPRRKDFTAQGEEGAINLIDESSTYSLAQWIIVTPQQAVIPAHRSQTFTYTITPPANAEPGGHFGSIVFATIPTKGVAGIGAIVSQEVASIILARVPGDVIEKANVESFSTDKSFYEYGPVTFDMRVKNTGGVHIRPAGSITITDMFGKKTFVEIDGRTVLPNSIRKMPTTWKPKFLIGKYHAELIAAYGTKNRQLNAETDFYTFPIHYGTYVLIVLFLLFLLRKRLGKALKALFTGK